MTEKEGSILKIVDDYMLYNSIPLFGISRDQHKSYCAFHFIFSRHQSDEECIKIESALREKLYSFTFTVLSINKYKTKVIIAFRW